MFNILLIQTLNEAKRTREDILNNKFKEHRTTTLILVAVVIVSLIAEIPMAVVLTLHAISAAVYIHLDYYFLHLTVLFSDFILVISFPINFAIYCSMSKKFRTALIDVMCGKPSGHQASQSASNRTQQREAF